MQVTTPDCYGKHWSATASECKGGLDAAYVHPSNNTHIRDRCHWFGACATATNTANAKIVPASQLTNRVITTPPPLLQVAQRTIPIPPAPPVIPQAQPQMRYSNVPALNPSAVLQGVPQWPGAQIPSYLTVAEPDDEEPWYVTLGRTIVRSALKGAAHSVASYIDHTPIKKK